MAKGLTKRADDYSRWYTDVIREADVLEDVTRGEILPQRLRLTD